MSDSTTWLGDRYELLDIIGRGGMAVWSPSSACASIWPVIPPFRPGSSVRLSRRPG